MSAYPFSDLIRSRRRDLALSQKQVTDGGEGKIGQPTLSAWETGRLLPRTEDPRLAALATVLDLPLSQIEVALREQQGAEVEQTLLTDEKYLSEQQEYVSEHEANGVDVWLLGPETLPVINSVRFREAWRTAIAAGVNYHIIWMLCTITPGAIPQLANILGDIGASAPEGTSAIHHYGLMVFPAKIEGGVPIGTDRYDENKADYVSLQQEAKDNEIAGNVFHDPLYIARTLPLYETMIRKWPFSPISSITVCKTRSRRREPLASVHLPSVRHSRAAAPGPVWHILDAAASFELASFIDKFTAHVKSKEDEKAEE